MNEFIINMTKGKIYKSYVFLYNSKRHVLNSTNRRINMSLIGVIIYTNYLKRT